MSKTLYLINPRSDVPTYFSAEVFRARGLGGTSYMADLATVTLAALAEPNFEVRICDENIQTLDLNARPDYVGITGKITQLQRMLEIAAHYRRHGVKVIIGGPCASLSPQLLEASCDVLVVGEIEPIAPALFSALAQGKPQARYEGERADLSRSPIPRWELYPNARAMSGTIQTSRGCPFECEFCDVIQYLGRKQRHKPIGLILRELDVLYAHGYRSIFIADDNFTVYRARAKELLSAMIDWNKKRADDPLRFITQVSIDAAKDPELLQLCAQANLRQLFIGIETPNPESLKESKKRQNLKIDLHASLLRFIEHGLTLYGGMIVGFDNDGPGIFEAQQSFAQALPIPIYSIGALVAPYATPLHARMKSQHRLQEGSEVAAMPWSTNIHPAQMSREALFSGLRWLCNQLYAPRAFGERIHALLDALQDNLPAPPKQPRRSELYPDLKAMMLQLPQLGEAELALFQGVLMRLERRVEARYYVYAHLIQYMQIRYMFEQGQFWDPALSSAAPQAAPSGSPKLPVLNSAS